MILAPIVRGRKGEFKKELDKLVQQGYVSARIDGELRNMADEEIKLDKRKNHTIEVVVDRLLVKNGIEHRLASAVESAMKLADGLVQVAVVGGEERLYSSKLACPECGINVPVLEPRSFSFNSVYGACPECNGLGSKYDFDPAKVITDWSKPLLDGGLGPGSASQNLIHSLQLAAAAYGFDLAKPFEQLPQKTQNLILYGPERGEKKKGGFLGVFAYLRRNMEDSSSQGYRDWLLDHMSATRCPACEGRRLRPESLAVKVNGMSIADFTAMPVSRAVEAAAQIKLNDTRGEDCWAHPARDCGAVGVPECRRTGLYLAGPLGDDAERRRRPAHPAGNADWIEAARRAVRARRAVHRTASSR